VNLDDPDADVRYAAVETLCKLGPVALSPYAGAIAQKLKDTDVDVRRVAGHALGKLVTGNDRSERMRRRTEARGS